MTTDTQGREEPLKAARAKFTPGPWTAKDISGAGWQIHAHLPVGFKFSGTARGMADGKTEFMTWTIRDRFPVQISDERWVQFSTGSWEEMQEANARLIASAPDLLEALMDYDNAFTSFNPEDAESRQVMRRAVIKARAAILKATSSSSPKGGSHD